MLLSIIPPEFNDSYTEEDSLDESGHESEATVISDFQPSPSRSGASSSPSSSPDESPPSSPLRGAACLVKV